MMTIISYGKRNAFWVELAVAVLTAALISCAICSAQSTADSGQASTPTRRDDWRKVDKPQKVTPSDPKEKQILVDRGEYFDHTPYASEVPLDQQQPTGHRIVSYGSIAPDSPEIPFFPNEAIVVAEFVDNQPYLTPSHLNIYTDVSMSIEQVIDAGPSNLRVGQTLDVLLDGGTIRLEDGRIISSHTFNESGNYSLQPHHRYLLCLEYVTRGNFFLDQKDWELNGIAIPDRVDEANRLEEGQAHYSGLPEDAFIQAVQNAVKAHQAGRP